MSRAQRPVSPLIWILAVLPLLFFLEQFVRHYATNGWDYVPIWNAARNLLHHHPLYFQGRPPDGPAFPDIYYLYLYPPSFLLIVWPLGLLGFGSAKLLFFLADSAAILLAGRLCLEAFSVRWRSLAGATMLCGLFLALPVTDTLRSGNVNGLVVAAEAAMLLAAVRRRWLLAGAFLGISLLMKPILLPLLLLFLAARKWRPAILALGIPVVVSLAVLPFSADGGQFLTRSVPFLISGNAAEFQRYNISIAGQAALVGMPNMAALLLRGLVATVGGLLIWSRWKRAGGESLRLIEVSGLVVLVTLLSFSFAWPYYVLFLLPWVASVWHPRSLLRNPLAWLGIFLAAGPDIAIMERFNGPVFHLGIARITFGLLLVFVAAGISLVGKQRLEVRALLSRWRPRMVVDSQALPATYQVGFQPTDSVRTADSGL